jgi:hypothetical protein
VHRLGNGCRGNRELAQLLWCQAAGLTLGDARKFGHASGYRTDVRLPQWLIVSREAGSRRDHTIHAHLLSVVLDDDVDVAVHL